MVMPEAITKPMEKRAEAPGPAAISSGIIATTSAATGGVHAVQVVPPVLPQPGLADADAAVYGDSCIIENFLGLFLFVFFFFMLFYQLLIFFF